MNQEEKRLLSLYRALAGPQRDMLREFAEFLRARGATPAETAVPQSPRAIPRPEGESVVGAIKRLSATYPMLERAQLLNETSLLVTQHVVHGRDAREVIDELEVLFRTRYEQSSG